MDSIIAALAIVGLVLGGGAFTGLLVFAVARFESSRMRRGVRAFAARLERPVFEEEPLARAWKLSAVRGIAGGYGLHLTTRPGAPMQVATSSTGHTNHRMLFATITLELTEGASTTRLGPVPSDEERARWRPSIRVDGARGRAELFVDPLTSEAAVDRCWVGVRVAATMLDEARAATEETRPQMKEPPRVRLVGLGHALDARVDAPYLIGVGSKELEFTDAILVGPFARAQTDEAWRAVEREFRRSGAHFVVFVRHAGKTFDRDGHLPDARAVLAEMPYSSTADVVEMNTWCVARCDAGGHVLLESDGRLPTREDARAAVRLALRAAPARAVAMVALAQRYWHAHM